MMTKHPATGDAHENDDDDEDDSPLAHSSVKKLLTITGTGVMGLLVAAWTWADSTTAKIAQHDLVVQRVPADVGELKHDMAVEKQAGLDRDRRLERMENKIDSIVEKLGATKPR